MMNYCMVTRITAKPTKIKIVDHSRERYEKQAAILAACFSFMQNDENKNVDDD